MDLSGAPPIVHQALGTGGRPLLGKTRRLLEERFGHSFSRVRVHEGTTATQSALTVNARAYTVGADIVVASPFDPKTSAGAALLAHELTHVVQQSQGLTAAARSGFGDEAEADRNARAVQSVAPLQVQARVPARSLQRQLIRLPEPDIGKQETESLLRAADRARAARSDRTRMMIAGAEIVYRLMHVYLPDRSDRISDVSYDPAVRTIRVTRRKDSLSVVVGSGFILTTRRATLRDRAADLRSAILAHTPRGAQDSAAIAGMQKAFCETPRTGFEYCGHLIRTGNGQLRTTGPTTSGKQSLCEAKDTISEDEKRVTYYHTHPKGQGYDFSEAGAGLSMGDTDRADHLGIDYYLINDRGDMKRHSPATEIGGRGRKRNLGRIRIECAGTGSDK